MFTLIKESLSFCWNLIKKMFLKVIQFFKNIVVFFRNHNRMQKLKEDQNRIAVSIKEKLDNGNYQVINCLYDKEENYIVDPEEDAQIMTSEEIDDETFKLFGSKEMIVLR